MSPFIPLKTQYPQKSDSNPYKVSGSSPPLYARPNFSGSSGSSPPPLTGPSFSRSSGSSPPTSRSKKTTLPAFQGTHFSGSIIEHPQPAKKIGWSTIAGPNILSQTLRDICGVYVPKLFVLRSSIQFFERSFLEVVEDLVFYFAVALAAFGLHKMLAKRAGLPYQ